MLEILQINLVTYVGNKHMFKENVWYLEMVEMFQMNLLTYKENKHIFKEINMICGDARNITNKSCNMYRKQTYV